MHAIPHRWPVAGHTMRLLCILIWMTLLLCVSPTAAKDLLVPKEQATTEFEPTVSPSFDEQKRGVPQAMFVWIKMAKGYEVEWDTFGRKGWYTQDPRLKPIDPGTTAFTPDASAVFIVFEVAPLEDPAQFGAQWFAVGEDGKPADVPVGQDTLEVPGHERYGFLELKKPGDRWSVGNYLVKLYITSLGQQAFHAVNQVGTMRFSIVGPKSPADPAVKKDQPQG